MAPLSHVLSASVQLGSHWYVQYLAYGLAVVRVFVIFTNLLYILLPFFHDAIDVLLRCGCISLARA